MANRSKCTPQKKGKILASVRRSGNVAEAARLVGIGRRTLYAWRAEDPAFAAACDEARQAYVDALETEADRRGVEGVIRPVFYKGEQVAEVREYSDTLLIFRLKGERPAKYRAVPVGIDPRVVRAFVQQVLACVDDPVRQELRAWVQAQMGALPGLPRAR